MSTELNIDALMPQAMAEKAESIGVRKAGTEFFALLALSILAGAFIGLGALFATTVYAGSSALPFGVGRLLMGLVFCLGLILVVVAGAELFTGNNLIVMAWASGKVSTGRLVHNWVVVYLGNFIGSLGTALLVFLSGQYNAGNGAVGETALQIALTKCHLGFVQAVALGILCNALVCLAVWLTYSARSTTDKILAIIFPITAFVAASFEHSIANMYFIPFGLFIKAFDPAFIVAHNMDLSTLTWSAFMVKNLIPVTIGNIIGGAGFVAIMYWFIYLHPSRVAKSHSVQGVDAPVKVTDGKTLKTRS